MCPMPSGIKVSFPMRRITISKIQTEKRVRLEQRFAYISCFTRHYIFCNFNNEQIQRQRLRKQGDAHTTANATVPKIISLSSSFLKRFM